MSYYSGKLIIHNHTVSYGLGNNESMEHILTMKFSVNFNDNRLYLTNTFINQLLESKALQNFIVKEINKHIDNNIEEFNSRIKKICSIENNPTVKVNVIGKYFFIKLYCGRNHTKEDCIKAIKRKLASEKTAEEILRGNE